MADFRHLKNLKGLILAGGQAIRFGGGKCLANLEKRPLITWVYEALRPFCSEIWISLRSEGDLKSFEGLCPERFVFDMNPGAGPAGAIFSALKMASSCTFLVAPCDQPLLQRPLLRYLLQKFEEKASLEALAFSNEKGRLLPFPGLYRKSVKDGALKEIFRRYKSETIPAAEWRLYDPQGLSFFNINRKEDLEEAAKLLKKYPGLRRENF